MGDGDLVVESAGRDGRTTFHDVAAPEIIQKLVHRLLDSREAAAPRNSLSTAEQIERLAALHAAKSISDAEFAHAKAEVLKLSRS